MTSPRRFAALVSILALYACQTPRPEPLRIFAAASLADLGQSVADLYGGAIEVSYGSTSSLARQIRDGAPADVFLSASPQWINYLRDAGALAGETMLLARNQLVAVAPVGSALAASATDLSSLRAGLEADDRVAIADEGVPAGEYARAALAELGLLEAYRAHLVGQRDVRAALLAVERGETVAGFVYVTDAKVAEVEILFTFPEDAHPAIEYQAATLQNATDAAVASSFLDVLASDAARALLVDAGFALP